MRRSKEQRYYSHRRRTNRIIHAVESLRDEVRVLSEKLDQYGIIFDARPQVFPSKDELAQKEFLSVTEASKYWSKSQQRIRKLIDQGRLHTVEDEFGRRLIARIELEQWRPRPGGRPAKRQS